jgi:hypothetical protein
MLHFMNGPFSAHHNETNRSKTRRILFLTTVSLTGRAGGAIYSQALRDALAAQGTVVTAIVVELQRHSSRHRRWLSAAVQSLFTWVPPNVLFHSGNLTTAGNQLIHQDWDLVVIDHLESAYAYRKRSTPVIFISHNRESKLISQKIPHAPRWIQCLLSCWVDRFERKTARSVDAVVTISSTESHWYRTLNRRVVVVPPVFNTVARPARPATHGKLRLGFLGGSKWLPNREAMTVLLDQILPHTRRPLELVIAGEGWEPNMLKAKLQNAGAIGRISINYLGCIDDIAEYWSTIDVFAAPIVTGAGVNVKVCEALANARPVIALPHALRGLDDVAQDLVWRATTPSEFAHALDSIDPTTFPSTPPDSLTPAHAIHTLAQLLSTITQRSSS